MKYGIIFIFLLMFLAACNNASAYHEDIDESFAKDTEAIKNIVVESIEDDQEFSEEEQEQINSYKSKYENDNPNSGEARAYYLTLELTEDHSTNLLPSDREKLIQTSEDISLILEDGYEKYMDKYKEEK